MKIISLKNPCIYIILENDKIKSLEDDYSVIQFDSSPDIIYLLTSLRVGAKRGYCSVCAHVCVRVCTACYL